MEPALHTIRIVNVLRYVARLYHDTCSNQHLNMFLAFFLNSDLPNIFRSIRPYVGPYVNITGYQCIFVAHFITGSKIGALKVVLSGLIVNLPQPS